MKKLFGIFSIVIAVLVIAVFARAAFGVPGEFSNLNVREVLGAFEAFTFDGEEYFDSLPGIIGLLDDVHQFFVNVASYEWNYSMQGFEGWFQNIFNFLANAIYSALYFLYGIVDYVNATASIWQQLLDFLGRMIKALTGITIYDMSQVGDVLPIPSLPPFEPFLPFSASRGRR